MSSARLRESLLAAVTALNGREGAERIIAPFSPTIDRIESVYEELSSIARYRGTYNSSWAFTYALRQMHALVTHLFTNEITEKITGYAGSFRNRRERSDILRKYDKITSNLSDLIRRTGTSQRIFRTTVWLISLAEGAISLFIVLLITETAEAFNRAVSLPRFSLLFLAVFGSLRLVLERLKTRLLQNWRWRRYQEHVDQAFDRIAVATGISCLWAHHIRQGTFLDTIDDLLEDGLELLQRKPTREERRSRRQGHRQARIAAEELERSEQIEEKQLRQGESGRHSHPVNPGRPALLQPQPSHTPARENRPAALVRSLVRRFRKS